MDQFRKVGLYWNTVRYLRLVQIYGRAQRRMVRPTLPQVATPERSPLDRKAWVGPAVREPSLEGPRRFSLLGETRVVTSGDWDGCAADKLWFYNINYFDDLNARNSAARTAWHLALLSDWAAETSPGKGVSWEPYPTSLRIVNWIKWALSGNELPPHCLESLAVQVRWLATRIETHLLGNHLFANAKALVFGGLFFQSAEADGWLKRGMSLLSRELPEQILADGGQFELSPMYHSLALEDMLDLINVTRAFAGRLSANSASSNATWPQIADRMRDWLAAMCHPDGEIAFFNDAAIGIAPSPAELDRYATRLGLAERSQLSEGVRHLEPSGYIRLGYGSMVALLDVARVGPDYLPGHAHADTLSFELSIGKQRVLVNSGTSCYGVSAERLRQRSTPAHNTVVVDGESSSQVWSGFRVARRARPFGLQLSEDTMTVACSHDGYRRLKGRPVHRREWKTLDDGLRIEDRVSGPAHHSVAYFHFHPDVQPQLRGSAQGHALLPGDRKVTWRIDGGDARLEPATWHPRFGDAVPTTRLAVDLRGGRSAVTFRWGG